MKLKIFLGLAVILFLSYSFANKSSEGVEKIQWLSFEEAVAKAEKKSKPIFIDVYTNWCGWCKVMDRKTFTDANIIKAVNKNFYAVKLNAETRDTINFKGKDFVFVNKGRSGYHELASVLMNKRMAYPTVVFLTDDMSKVYPHAGYQKVPVLTSLLAYYGGNYHNKMDYQTFQKSQKGQKGKFNRRFPLKKVTKVTFSILYGKKRSFLIKKTSIEDFSSNKSLKVSLKTSFFASR